MTDESAGGREAGVAETNGGSSRPAAGLGTFLGVYLPTTLTILGVMMYLRIGAVTGHVGIGGALLIVVVANLITLITAFSFSAVATNIRVGVGGAYFIISRSLGVEVGGAVGLPLFLSQVFSVTLYAFGLAEAATLLWPDLPVQTAAFVIIVAVAALAFAGPTLALRAQVPLLGFIVVSLVALGLGFAFGKPVVAVAADAEPILDPTLGFWGVFAVFFPAVTGVMAGLGLSGDLANPGRSIPRGSISATLTGLAVYLVVPIVLFLAADPEVLRTDRMVWTRIAPLGAWLIFPGLLGAIFSSAVGSILGAPRTLQALSLDRLAPKFLAREANPERGPIVGLLVSTLLALGAVFLGDLNSVALVVAMFFLTVYGTVNIVAALEGLSGDPSWRPKLRFPWPISLLGGIACFAVMFLIHPLAAVVAIVVEIALYVFLDRRGRAADWGDARRGAYEALIRWSLVKLRTHAMRARSWRPHVLVFASEVERRLPLVRFGYWFAQGRGVVTICELVVGELGEVHPAPDERQRRAEKVLLRERLGAFAEVNVVRDLTDGIIDVAQANGIAGMQSNTVLLGWPRDVTRMGAFLAAMRALASVHKSVVIGRVDRTVIPDALARLHVHVWWGGLQSNGDLMLLLAHLLTRNPEWRRSRITVMSIVRDDAARIAMERSLAELMTETRIEARTRVIMPPPAARVADVIHIESARADVVFLGLQVPKAGDEVAYAERLAALAAPLRTVFFVKNSSLFRGELL